MVFFKCKMCGGTVEFEQGATVGVCDSCGTKQTLPRLDDDKKANLYDRANHFRRNNEYDKAMGIYEQILAEDNTDAEAYWSLVLCRYGIEYVEDPATHKRVPTVNRAQYMSVSADEDYKSALKYADAYQRAIYEQEAKTIDEIQKGILEISSKEEPFDIFISYKETDESGRRTPDSVLANDLYHQLTNDGFKVFFSRITLEDKLGTAYEPYIFSALNSAKVMVVIGTKPEYFNAVWVKNEWSRYLALVKKSDGKKMIIPAYRDMDPYDLPEEFSHLQAQDMSKLGFMQDLIRGIKKIVQADEPKPVVKETVVVNGGSANVAPLLKRVFMFLEDSNWEEADEYCEKVLDQDPENAQAYLGKLMAELKVRKPEQLADCKTPFDKSINYQKVMRFGDDILKQKIQNYTELILKRILTSFQQEADVIIAESQKNKFMELNDRKNSLCTELDHVSTELDYVNDIVFQLDSFNEKLSQYNIELQDLQSQEEELSFFDRKKKKCINEKIASIETTKSLLKTEKSKLLSILSSRPAKNSLLANLEAIKSELAEIENAAKQIQEKQISEKISKTQLSVEEAIELTSNERIALLVAEKYPFLYKKYLSKKLLTAKQNDSIFFGTYPQEAGNKRSSIKWFVLEKEGNTALIISEKALDCKQYNTFATDDITWETCSLRRWLNDTFFNEAFNAFEQARIKNTNVSADNNPKYRTSSGNATTDKVFLLSITEVEKYFSTDEERKCVPTEYAKANGAYTDSSHTKGGAATCCWWLRSPGSNQNIAAEVNLDGSVYFRGDYVSYDNVCVRPAMWVSID